MLSVCITRPEHGMAKYSSRWRCVFQAKVPTRSAGSRPRRSRALHRRRVRSPTWPQVWRHGPPGPPVTTDLSGEKRMKRRKMDGRVSGKSIIVPFIGAPSPSRHAGWPKTSSHQLVPRLGDVLHGLGRLVHARHHHGHVGVVDAGLAVTGEALGDLPG